jgi:hypothetical protein
VIPSVINALRLGHLMGTGRARDQQPIAIMWPSSVRRSSICATALSGMEAMHRAPVAIGFGPQLIDDFDQTRCHEMRQPATVRL